MLWYALHTYIRLYTQPFDRVFVAAAYKEKHHIRNRRTTARSPRRLNVNLISVDRVKTSYHFTANVHFRFPGLLPYPSGPAAHKHPVLTELDGVNVKLSHKLHAKTNGRTTAIERRSRRWYCWALSIMQRTASPLSKLSSIPPNPNFRSARTTIGQSLPAWSSHQHSRDNVKRVNSQY